jgi:hypothetical protein
MNRFSACAHAKISGYTSTWMSYLLLAGDVYEALNPKNINKINPLVFWNADNTFNKIRSDI